MQKQWSIDVRNPALEKDPLQSIKDREQEVRAQKDVARQNETRIRQGLPTLPPPVRVPTLETEPQGLSVIYIYEVKFHNSGMKRIRTITWDWVFSEPGTEQELGRVQFVRKVTISPGKSRNVLVHSATPPTDTIDARKAGKKLRDQYTDQVVIKSVGYADGSTWRAPN